MIQCLCVLPRCEWACAPTSQGKGPCCTPAAWAWVSHFPGSSGSTGLPQHGLRASHSTPLMSADTLRPIRAKEGHQLGSAGIQARQTTHIMIVTAFIDFNLSLLHRFSSKATLNCLYNWLFCHFFLHYTHPPHLNGIFPFKALQCDIQGSK